MPAHAPCQPVNFHPAAGFAVRCTDVEAKVVVHTPGHEMPAGELAIVPRPETAAVTRNGASTNVAVASASALIESTQDGALPEHDPPQCENFQPAAGTATSDTVVPLST